VVFQRIPERLLSQVPRRRRTKRRADLNPTSQEQDHSSSAPTTALDLPEVVFQSIKEAMNVLKPFLKQSTAFQPCQAKIQALHFQLRKEHLTPNGASKTYQQILKLLATLPLPEYALTQVHTHLHEAMKPFHSSRYAEHRYTDIAAINRITLKFLEAAQRTPLPGGQCHPPLGIRLTDAQYSKVRDHLKILSGHTDIPDPIRHKARQMAYTVSDKAKAAKASYNASDHGKATRASYNASDQGKAAKSKYDASDKGQATRRKRNEKQASASQAQSPA
jgi:hypothetical protein